MFDLRKAVHYAVVEFVAKGLNWVTLLALPFILTIEQYGNIGLFVAVEGIVSLITLVGQEKAILKAQNEKNTCLLSALIISCTLIGTLSVLSVGYYGLISPYLIGLNVMSVILPLLAGVLIFNIINLLMVRYRADENVVGFRNLKVLFNLSKFIFTIGACYATRDATAYIYGLIGAGVLTMLVNKDVLISSLKLRYFSLRSIFSQLRFGWPFIFHSVGGSLIMYMDRFILVYLISNEALGEYTLIYSIGASLTFLFVALSVYVEPLIYRLHAEGKEYLPLLQLYRNSLFALASTASIVIIFLWPYLKELGYADYTFSTFDLALMLLAFCIQPLYFSLVYEITAIGRTSIIAFSTLSAMLVSVVSNFVLVEHVGFTGAIHSKLITFVFQPIVILGMYRFFYGRKSYDFYVIGIFMLSVGVLMTGMWFDAMWTIPFPFIIIGTYAVHKANWKNFYFMFHRRSKQGN